MTQRRWIGAALALAVGLAAGMLDLRATDVQGPALIMMLGAFAGTLAGAHPLWSAAAAVLGLVGAHAGAWAAAGSSAPSAGMLVALLPAAIAAFAGLGVRALVARAGDAIPRAVGPSSRALLGGALVACAAVGAGPLYATLVARGQPIAWWVALWWQLATLVAWTTCAPFVARRVQARSARRDANAPATPPRRELSDDAGLVLVAALGHAVAIVALTRLLFVPLGTASAWSAVAWALAAYLPVDALAYALVAALAYASDVERQARDEARRTAALSAALSESRLAALRAQLRPHFLFNALNAATVLARRGDSSATAQVLADLAELLRYVLADDAPDDTVPLAEEVAFVRRYLDVERVRFSDRLRAVAEVDEPAGDARVPRLLLQPLVENAVRHGVAGRIGAGLVRVHAWAEHDRLHVTVEDDGPGPGDARGDVPGDVRGDGTGVGLANTRARLAALYGGDASLALGTRAEGGAVARVTLPLRVA